MTIIRGEIDTPANHYTQLPNKVARESELSFKARGIFLELASHRVGWKMTVEYLARGKDGKSAVNSGLKELREAGWLTLTDDGEWVFSSPGGIENPQDECAKIEHKEDYNNTNIKEHYTCGRVFNPIDGVDCPDCGSFPACRAVGPEEKSSSADPPRRKPARRKPEPEVPLPADWQPTERHREKAKALGVDVDAAAERMRRWAFANDKRRSRWDQTFNNFLAGAPTVKGSVSVIGVEQRVVELIARADFAGLRDLGVRVFEPTELIKLPPGERRAAGVKYLGDRRDELVEAAKQR